MWERSEEVGEWKGGRSEKEGREKRGEREVEER